MKKKKELCSCSVRVSRAQKHENQKKIITFSTPEEHFSFPPIYIVFPLVSTDIHRIFTSFLKFQSIFSDNGDIIRHR